MTSPREYEPFRALIIRKDTSQLLFDCSANGVRLPVLTIPPYTRPAELLTEQTKKRWNLKTFCLATLPAWDSSDPIPQTAILEVRCSSVDIPRDLKWRPIASLREERDPSFAIAERALQSFGRLPDGQLTAPFGHCGWLDTVVAWVEAKAAAIGLRLTGDSQQLNASPTFSLMRFETDGPALWFKAVGEPNLREYPVTLMLSQYFSRYVPQLVASRPEWNAWLSVEAGGVHPGQDSNREEWEWVAVTLAELQIASLGHALHLLDAGCRDARTASLVELAQPFFAVMADLMGEQRKPSPSPLSRDELTGLEAQLVELCNQSARSEAPNALGHFDCNPGNILIADDRCVFLDWAEASVGHPFLTFQYLMEHLARLMPTDSGLKSAIERAYVKCWASLLSPDEISRAIGNAPLLAVFAYAVCQTHWRDPQVRYRPHVAAYLRSLTRRMKSEVERLGIGKKGRVRCLA